MVSLFSDPLIPLASRLRPQSLHDCIGQKHLLGEGRMFRKFLQGGRIPSMILWGPPGVGKTTLARIISQSLDAKFFHLSGVLSKKDDLLSIIQIAKQQFDTGLQTVVFLDEIHRWTKTQQDVLLPWVEKGVITLIGATTENPAFTINNALLSRCLIFQLELPTQEDLLMYLQKIAPELQNIFPKIIFPPIDDIFFKNLTIRSGGDIRSLLNMLEGACLAVESGQLQEHHLDGTQQYTQRFDDGGEAKYTLISAFHKSLRDSDGDAAVYYLGRMLAGGEDPRYIARRMMNFASEDVDISQENCLILAHTAYEVCEKMGMPECELPLIRVTYILAQAKKNNHVLVAQQRMHADLAEYGNLPVPLHLRNASHPALSQLGYGKGYEYAPNMPDGQSSQEHFPEVLHGRKYLDT